MTSNQYPRFFGEDIDSDDLDENIPIKTTLNTVLNRFNFRKTQHSERHKILGQDRQLCLKTHSLRVKFWFQQNHKTQRESAQNPPK